MSRKLNYNAYCLNKLHVCPHYLHNSNNMYNILNDLIPKVSDNLFRPTKKTSERCPIDENFEHLTFAANRRTNNNNNNKKLSYRRDSARCVKRPFKVTQGHALLYQSTRHIWLPISIQ